MVQWDQIAAHIRQATGKPFEPGDRRSVGGGCINQGYRLSDGDRTYFVKLNQASQIAMFEAEVAGLRDMEATGTIRVPKPVCYGTNGSTGYLVLEWIDLGRGSSQAWNAMGRQLAAMHRATSRSGFGWQINNTIGSTPQVNSWTEDWTEFWIKHRIGFQLNLAKRRGGYFPQEKQLLEAIPALLADHAPQPSLVHGDLWSGNAAISHAGEPVIFDPAAYYGDREVDIAMTELFGGFPSEFYQGYNQVWALEPGYQQRKLLYNLYHILNHFNLFGGGYESQANRMIEQIVAGRYSSRH
ncbi:fructosamine kinase family protein [Leptothermofonsia sichuanensis E412]|uniref:fructosamine kinase family protein n=1 Tax=Leptothermofonsia sichuanensis TaxID=2917832 RepID=UPI001CA77078|nr:fructosamine kinase family protein [Leptothermofonsia sichuanensis]QZZ21643.1 fructosamine kinase family protein [Leptothermofonsia sichuanensis E412]